MTPELIGVIIVALAGGGGIAAVINAVYSKKTVTADAMATWSTVWNENLTVLRDEIGALRDRVAVLEGALEEEQAYNKLLTAVLIENRIDLP